MADGASAAPSFSDCVAAFTLPPRVAETQDDALALDVPAASADVSAARELDSYRRVPADNAAPAAEGSQSVRHIAVSYERIVPLTRLPLRSRTSAITWFVTPPDADAQSASRQRLELLERYGRGAASADAETLLRAHREEETEGRIHALRALAKYHATSGIAAFDDALRTGTDDERAIAIDGLVAAGARERVRALLHDRVDAIAAKAAIAYVGSNRRVDFTAALRPLLDDGRVATLLALLAGYIE